VCPYCYNISGAIYSGEPQKEYASSSDAIFGLASPKSATFKCPSLSIRIFSGFKSLYNIF